LDDDPVERVADRLMESALSRGARDNVSVVVVACQA
jgi:serine/threonine protein phosphatase PrpC